MNKAEIRDTILRALTNIAPECDPASIDETAPLRETLDLDSMDYLNFLIAVDRDLHIDIPESDYPKVQTLAALIAYVENRAPAS
jgi:acyl carrier protein